MIIFVTAFLIINSCQIEVEGEKRILKKMWKKLKNHEGRLSNLEEKFTPKSTTTPPPAPAPVPSTTTPPPPPTTTLLPVNNTKGIKFNRNHDPIIRPFRWNSSDKIHSCRSMVT